MEQEEEVKLRKAVELARQLGISRRTMSHWCKKDPDLALMIDGVYWIKLDRLVGRHGIGPIDAYLLGAGRWIKATEAAKMSGISRKTIANWCRDRPRFAKRIGRVYYIDLDDLGASDTEMVEFLQNSRATGALGDPRGGEGTPD